MTARKTSKTTETPAASGLSFTRTTADPSVFKAKRQGGERGSRFVIDPDVQNALRWTTLAAENVLTVKLDTFPPARTRTAPGEPMTEGPATVESARRYLDLHAEPIGLGVKVRLTDDGEHVQVKAGKRVQRLRKTA